MRSSSAVALAPEPTPAVPARVPYVSTHPISAFAHPEVSITLVVPHATGDALLAAIEEIRDRVGARLSAQTHFRVEDSLTMATIGLGAVSAQLRRAGFSEDVNYAG